METTTISEKRCSRCREVKPISQFHRNRATADGRTNNCIPCQQHYLKERRAAAPEQTNLLDTVNRWGISLGRWNQMMTAQGGCCAICQIPLEGLRICVDHDHACCATIKEARKCGNCVRGLLCISCNTGLGCFRDNASHLAAAIAYLA